MVIVSLPFTARAQVSKVANPIQFGIAAGAAIPMSDLSTATNTGFNVTGIEVERSRMAKEGLFVPALLLLAAIMWLQQQRRRPSAKTQARHAIS